MFHLILTRNLHYKRQWEEENESMEETFYTVAWPGDGLGEEHFWVWHWESDYKQFKGPLMSSADWSGGTREATVCHPQPSCQLGMLSWLILEFTLNPGDSQDSYYCIRLGTKRLTFPFHYSEAKTLEPQSNNQDLWENYL